jgi:uncharacterized protein YndB with AHSA1/START domain
MEAPMQASRTAVEVVPDLVLVKSTTLPSSVSESFRLFTEPRCLETWLCERASVDARVGGLFELFWTPDDPQNDSTIGCSITAFEPDRVLAFQWRSPRQFKVFANVADPLTHVVVAFHGVDGACVVTLVHSGWRSTPEWLEAAEWQSVAWDYAFQALQVRAASGAA